MFASYTRSQFSRAGGRVVSPARRVSLRASYSGRWPSRMRWASAALSRGRPQARFDPAVDTSHGSPVVSASSRGRPHWPPCRHRCPRTVVQPFAATRRPAFDSLGSTLRGGGTGRFRPRAALHKRVLICRVSTPTAMETLTKHFESRVDASLERTGVTPSTFDLHRRWAIPTWCVSSVLVAPRGWRWPTRSRCSSRPAAGPCGPCSLPGQRAPEFFTEQNGGRPMTRAMEQGMDAPARVLRLPECRPARGWRGARSTCGWPTAAFPNRSG